jgi:trans-aconitate methyltransferase
VPEHRRLTFGRVAELYDRARPSYPEALIDDVLALAGPGPALEVGAGTGKATIQFAARGCRVLALEPSPAMAAIARRNCPGVTVEQAEFERWEPAGRSFGLIYSAQAWHWIDPAIRFRKARELLGDGGLLAPFWNRVDWEACALSDELHAVYARVAPELAGANRMMPAAGEEESWLDDVAGTGFIAPEIRSYPWRREYSTREYVDLLSTHSHHIILERRVLSELLEGVGAVIDRHGGRLQLPYVTRLCLAHR